MFDEARSIPSDNKLIGKLIDQSLAKNSARWNGRQSMKWTLSEKLKGSAAVCVTVPHRALTAPRRVASLKSRLAPTCPTRGNADWPLLPATAAIGTLIELLENFPRYISFGSQAQPPSSHRVLHGEKSRIHRTEEEGKTSRKRGGRAYGPRGIFSRLN